METKVNNLPKYMSKSQFITYLNCPYQFKRYYLDKYPRSPSEAQRFGTKVHQCIETMFNFSKNHPDKISAFDRALLGIPNDVRLYAKTYFSRMAAKYNKCIDNNTLYEFFPIHTELRVRVEHDMLMGIADLIFTNEANETCIMEIKTGKFSEKKLKMIFKELCFYAYVFTKHGLNITHVGVNFVKDDISRVWIPDFSIIDTIKKVRQNIKDKNFKPKKNEYCYFCNFKYECELM